MSEIDEGGGDTGWVNQHMKVPASEVAEGPAVPLGQAQYVGKRGHFSRFGGGYRARS